MSIAYSVSNCCINKVDKSPQEAFADFTEPFSISAWSPPYFSGGCSHLEAEQEQTGLGMPITAKETSISLWLGLHTWHFSPKSVFVTFLRPNQSQIKATLKRQMAKEHNICQTFQITNSWWQELLVALCKHPWASLSHAGVYSL